MNATQVVIADDHPLMRAALREAVSSQVPGVTVVESSSVARLVEVLSAGSAVDAVFLDLNMPDAQGFSALVRLRAQFPDIPVLIVSATEDTRAVDRALLLGAAGYVVKSAPIETVGQALVDVLAGHVVRPPVRTANDALEEAEATQFRKLRTLTPQQLNVLVMTAEGHSNKAIASRLHITEATVKAHITSVLLKLGLQRRTQAAILAQRALQLKGFVGLSDDNVDGDGPSEP